MDPRKQVLSKVVSLLWLLSLLFSALINCFPASIAYAASVLPLVSDSTPTDAAPVIASAAGGMGGDYQPTLASEANDFQTNTFTDTFSGNFSTSYPIPVPPA